MLDYRASRVTQRLGIQHEVFFLTGASGYVNPARLGTGPAALDQDNAATTRESAVNVVVLGGLILGIAGGHRQSIAMISGDVTGTIAAQGLDDCSDGCAAEGRGAREVNDRVGTLGTGTKFACTLARPRPRLRAPIANLFNFILRVSLSLLLLLLFLSSLCLTRC